MTSRSLKELSRKLTNLTLELVRLASPLTTLFEKDRVRYWQALPLRRMASMALGVFCTFGGLSFFIDLVNWTYLPEWAVLGLGALIGVNAVIFFAIIYRRNFTLVPVLAVLAIAAISAPRWLPHGSGTLTPDEARQRILFDAAGMLAAGVLGYRFFFRFMDTEGMELARIRTELDLAHGIQQTLVPPIRHTTDAFEVYGVTLPCENVGGDLVDLIPAGEGWLACLADVSGHGIPAGVLMANLKTALRLGCAQAQTIPDLLEAANRVLPTVKQPGMYATIACLFFTEGRQVEHSLAGHPPVLHYRAATAEIERHAMNQFPLGLMPAPGYQSARVPCEPGDLFVLVSDGIVEATDAAGAEFGLEGVERVIGTCADKPLEQITNTLFAVLKTFGPPADDQSVLLVRVRNLSGESK